MVSPGLFQYADANRRRSVILIVVAVLLLGLFGLLLGEAVGRVPWIGLSVATGLALVLALTAWTQGGALVLAASGAKEIGKSADPELVNVVEELCIASGLPRPRIFVIDSQAPNAFATGMAPEKSAVAITRGLRERLTREELQGVMAHEMAHIGNRDTRVMVLMAVIVGSIAILADIYLRGMRYGGMRSKGKGAAPMAILALVCAILAPLAATMVQFAVSRRREYLADATGAAMTRNPGALADALEKLSTTDRKLESATRGTQHLFIVNPLRPRQTLNHVFATHPPVAERIRKLRALAGAR